MIATFVKRIVFFSIGLLMVIIPLDYIVDSYLNTRSTADAFFIWGDSQTYFGIDLPLLNKASNKDTHSAAFQGASIYDFLVFTEKIPANAHVVFSISKLCQIQWKHHERNSSDFSVKALRLLAQQNYTLSQLLKIALNNKSPKNLFIKNNNSFLYPNRDTVSLTLPPAHFKQYYKEIPDYMEDKHTLFLEGIKTLKAKNSKISIIEFPYHPILQEIEQDSPIYAETEHFKNRIKDLFEDFKIDTIQMDNNRNVMYDLSHLNRYGAEQVSENLAKQLNKQEQTTLYIFKWRAISSQNQ